MFDFLRKKKKKQPGQTQPVNWDFQSSDVQCPLCQKSCRLADLACREGEWSALEALSKMDGLLQQ
jgi:hypothetical protein